MCGIIAITRRRSKRPVPSSSDLNARLGVAVDRLPAPTDPDLGGRLAGIADTVALVDRELRGEPGLRALLEDRSLPVSVGSAIDEIGHTIDAVETHLEAEGDRLPTLESINAALVQLKDAVWALERDRLRAAAEVTALAGDGDLAPSTVAAFFSIQQALSNLDRLEVRGRDSAGLHVLVRNHGLDLDASSVAPLLADRVGNDLFTHGTVRTPDDHLAFVYKAAAEIGELGDNTAAMRAAIVGDELLQLALRQPEVEATVLAHTRWASVGIISEPNAHPIDSEEIDREPGPYVTAVLNGDVDNFADLIAAESLSIAGEITTDAKVIPTLVSRGLTDGHDLDEAVRSAVAQFEGSVAIGVSTAGAPDDLHLALRGSGQGVFVGLAEDAFVVASEPYGVVEDSDVYLRMDGETPADPDNPTASQGQILRLRGSLAGDRAGVERFAYDGTPLPIGDDEWKQPAVTTRDIDRGAAPHFLLKEISESPLSFRKTLRGRLVDDGGRFRVNLPAETISPAVAGRMAGFRRVKVIGQGTAAVAGRAVAAAITDALVGTDIPVEAITATELSGFHLRDEMGDTLIVAISQSGTTTDTNRTVDLARSRGATVIAIVNRRGSDLVDKSDGVLYTSDGRDVEMSVASTKAFYAQIAAGFLLADALTDLVPGTTRSVDERQSVLAGLAGMPDAMMATLKRQPDIAPRRRSSRTEPSVLGDGRQRCQPRGGRGDPDQAVGALLQGDRLRRHRGQEAHRPVVGADDPGVCRRPGGLQCRRRGQGSGDLPSPQGSPDRDRDRRGEPVQRSARGDRRSRRAPQARVRPLDDRRSPVRLRGGARDRRLRPPAARGPRRDRRLRRSHRTVVVRTVRR